MKSSGDNIGKVSSLEAEKSGDRSFWGVHQVPNGLCLARVILVYVSMYFLLDGFVSSGEVSYFWLAVASVAALTDKLDGFLAKRYGWTSRLGAYLDQMSDKMVTFVVYAALTMITGMGGFVLAGIVFRELIVTGLRTVGNKISVEVSTSQAGKVKTFYQQVAALVLVVDWALPYDLFCFSYVQYVVWVGLGIFWSAVLVKRKTSFAWLRSVYEVRLGGAGSETTVSSLDYYLVVSCFVLALVPFKWIGAASVLYLTLGTGFTYLYNFVYAVRYGSESAPDESASSGSSRNLAGPKKSVWLWVGFDLAVSAVLSGLLWFIAEMYRDSTVIMGGVITGYSLLFAVFLVINYRSSRQP